MDGPRFSEAERRQLMATPGLGPTAIERLERAGLGSFELLRRLGPAAAARRVCESLGSGAWMNRRRALERLLQSAA